MSLRRQSLSPTANLLRNSRLFSIPNPLPRPPASVQFRDGAGVIKESETATRPFPTHQAIATTPKSAARGDWGLKRPLPLRSRLLQSGDPVVRVNALDTIEHITDFDSATDHVRTRQKFEELGIPVLKGIGTFKDKDGTALPPTSSFESQADVTSYSTTEGLDGAGLYLRAIQQAATERSRSFARKLEEYEVEKTKAIKEGKPVPEPPVKPQFRPFTPPEQTGTSLLNNRWKHDGPWLPGMSADEFTNYLSREVSARASEFNQCLEEYVKGQIYTTRSTAARNDHKIPLDPVEAEVYHAEQEKKWSTISPAEVRSAIRLLRNQCAKDPLNSELVTKLIIPFLRLPPMKVKHQRYNANQATQASEAFRLSDETMPQSTHPSAGLSYLRSKSFLSNHPILGPQAAHAPVLSRVIQGRVTRVSTEVSARLGVAGFVATDEFRQRDASSGYRGVSDVQHLDIDTPGGKKLLVEAHYGAVTPEGRLLIRVTRSYGSEVTVGRGDLEDAPPVRPNATWRGAGLGKSDIPELSDMLANSGGEAEQKQAKNFFRKHVNQDRESQESQSVENQ